MSSPSRRSRLDSEEEYEFMQLKESRSLIAQNSYRTTINITNVKDSFSPDLPRGRSYSEIAPFMTAKASPAYSRTTQGSSQEERSKRLGRKSTKASSAVRSGSKRRTSYTKQSTFKVQRMKSVSPTDNHPISCESSFGAKTIFNTLSGLYRGTVYTFVAHLGLRFFLKNKFVSCPGWAANMKNSFFIGLYSSTFSLVSGIFRALRIKDSTTMNFITMGIAGTAVSLFTQGRVRKALAFSLVLRLCLRAVQYFKDLAQRKTLSKLENTFSAMLKFFKVCSG